MRKKNCVQWGFVFTLLFLSIFIQTGIAAEGKEKTSRWKFVARMSGEDAPSGKLQDACAIDLDSEGNVFIVDRSRNRLLKFSPERIFLKEIGGFGDGAEEFSAPNDVCARRTLNIYVADYNNDRISRFDAKLNYLSEMTSDDDAPFHYEMPLSVTVSGQYDIFLLEDLNKRVIKLDRFNQTRAVFGDASQNLGQLLSPQQIDLSESGKVFVSDPGAQAVVLFDYLGNFLSELKYPEFRQPSGIFVNSSGDLLVADPESQKIFFFTAGTRFSGVCDLKPFGIRPLDVAMFISRGTGQSIAYVLAADCCLVFVRPLDGGSAGE